MDIDAIIANLHTPEDKRDYLDEIATLLDGRGVSHDTMVAAKILSEIVRMVVGINISLGQAELINPDGNAVTVTESGEFPEDFQDYVDFLSALGAITREDKSPYQAARSVILAMTTHDGKTSLAKEALDTLRKNPEI